MKELKCPVCAKLFKQNFYKSFNGYKSYKCGICSHIYIDDCDLLETNFSELYQESFYENYMNGLGYDAAYHSTLRPDFYKKMKLLQKILPKGSSVLEVGSGPGYFAKHLIEAGFKVDAIELTPGAKEYASKYNQYDNLIVEDISSSNCSIRANKYRCVISWAVIEHVQDVQNYLALLKSYCEDDGYLILDTGVTSSFTRAIDVGFTNWLYPPYHLHVFSNTSFKMLFNNQNLQIVYFYTFWNQENSIFMRIYRSIRILLKAFGNIPSVITKKNPGYIARIGLIVAKNSRNL